jgi:hypothetical protein
MKTLEMRETSEEVFGVPFYFLTSLGAKHVSTPESTSLKCYYVHTAPYVPRLANQRHVAYSGMVRFRLIERRERKLA